MYGIYCDCPTCSKSAFFLIRLTNLDELDCSFNEIEALPSTVGQCVSIRTFAADHNFLMQLPPEVSVHYSVYACLRRYVKWSDMSVWWLTAVCPWFLPPHRWATGKTQLCCSYIPTSWSLCLRRWVTCRSSRSSTSATTSESGLMSVQAYGGSCLRSRLVRFFLLMFDFIFF